MTERLATWVWVGASALACVAGMVNVVGYLGFEHQAITHLTGTSVLRLGRRYGVALAFEAALLVAAVTLFERGSFAGPLLAAVAIGLQNAMATTYSGALVRTSHVSGMFTDLGIMLGHALRSLPVARRRLALCVLVIACFFAGGVGGALLFDAIGYRSLYVPAALTGAAGFGYFAYRLLNRA
jgi:uncharacterized membrane protein YoaK (UPF0700 family)